MRACHIVCKKKTDQDVGIDVEVEDQDSLASSAENGEVRRKKNCISYFDLLYVCANFSSQCPPAEAHLYPPRSD